MNRINFRSDVFIFIGFTLHNMGFFNLTLEFQILSLANSKLRRKYILGAKGKNSCAKIFCYVRYLPFNENLMHTFRCVSAITQGQGCLSLWPLNYTMHSIRLKLKEARSFGHQFSYSFSRESCMGFCTRAYFATLC